MRAAQKSESPAATGLFAELTSIYSGAQSTANGCIPKAPAYARMTDEGAWCIEVLICPLCKERHIHGGYAEPRPDFSVRLSHCRENRGQYAPTRIDMTEWSRRLGISEAGLIAALEQLATVKAVDRRFKLPYGTAEAAALALLEAAE